MDFDCLSSDEEDWTQSIHSSLIQVPKGAVEHAQTIIHIDIDCFYAQVEMIRNPELVGKPVGIQQKNIIVTSNYEARARGVGKLVYLKEAKKACPELCIVNGEDLTHYRDMSYQITALLTKFSGTVERLGFDENFVDVSDIVGVPPWTEVPSTPEGFVYQKNPSVDSSVVPDRQCTCGCERRLTIASHIAAEMRKTLHAELGITCCAGVAHNKLLAKLVGGTHKPNQQTVLYPCSVGELMCSVQELRKIPGLGHKTCKRLESLGVTSVSALQHFSVESLEEEFGQHTAQTLQNLSRGIDESKVIKTGQPQSISDEDSFRKCDNMIDAKAKISELLDSVIQRVNADGRVPQTLRVSIRKLVPGVKYPNRQSRQGPIPSACFTKGFDRKEKLLDLCMQLFEKLLDPAVAFHLTLINVCVLNFTSQTSKKGHIDSFFTSPKRSSTVSKMSKTAQSVNEVQSVRKHDTVKGRNIQVYFKEAMGTQSPRKCEESERVMDKCIKEDEAKGWFDVQKSNTGHSLGSSRVLHTSESNVTLMANDCDVCMDQDNKTKLGSTEDCSTTDDRNLTVAKAAKAELSSQESSLTGTEENLLYLKSHLSHETEFNVFIELPLDIQKELILVQKPTTTETVLKTMLTIVESLHTGDSKHEEIKPTSQALDPTQVAYKSTSDLRSVCSNEVLDNSVTVKPLVGSLPNNSLYGHSTNNNNKEHNKKCVDVESGTSVPSHLQSSGKTVAMVCSRDNTRNQAKDIPPGYDVAVFRELPVHIQKSLMAEYKAASEFKTMKKRKLDTSNTSPESIKKGTKKRPSGSDIANFFKKR